MEGAIVRGSLAFLQCLDSDEIAETCRRELDVPRHVAAQLGRSAVEATRQGYYIHSKGDRGDWGATVRAARAAKVSIAPISPLPEAATQDFAETWITSGEDLFEFIQSAWADEHFERMDKGQWQKIITATLRKWMRGCRVQWLGQSSQNSMIQGMTRNLPSRRPRKHGQVGLAGKEVSSVAVEPNGQQSPKALGLVLQFVSLWTAISRRITSCQ